MVKAKAKKVRVTWRDAVSHSEWLDPNTAKTFKPYINVTVTINHIVKMLHDHT